MAFSSSYGNNSKWASWWPSHRKPVLIGLIRSGIMLTLLFVGVMSWFFGSAYNQRYRTHKLKILAVDFDGGAIGQSVPAAYAEMANDEFPTFEFASSSQYPDSASLRQAVCSGRYWGAVYSHSGASDRLQNAVSGSSSDTYNTSDAISYIYSETRYPATALSFVKSNLETIIMSARSFYYQTDGGKTDLASLNTSNTEALAAYLDPFEPTEEVMHPMAQGDRVYYNTVNMVMPILSQFFFVLAQNGISAEAGAFTSLSSANVWFMRLISGKIYTLVVSLGITGYMWGLREDWAVQAIHFARTWMILWFYMDVNNLIFDTLIGSFIPMHFAPFFVLFWILTNVASTVFPFELSAGFYRIGFLFPGHETYLLLLQAWTGCFKKDYIALPVMFSWWVVGHITTMFSTHRRCVNARRMAAAQAGDDSPMDDERKGTSDSQGVLADGIGYDSATVTDLEGEIREQPSIQSINKVVRMERHMGRN